MLPRYPSAPTIVAIVLAFLLPVGIAWAPEPVGRTLHVDCNSTCPAPDGSEGCPYPTIQEGIDAAVDGDTVLVRPCTYYENTDFLGKGITVTSTDTQDLSVVAATVIDGGGAGSAVRFVGGEGPDAILQGLTVRNGNGTISGGSRRGGGVYCGSSSPTIMNNIVTGNAAFEGGAICCESSSSIIRNNIVVENSAFLGGGIACSSSSPTIAANAIIRNTAYWGAGVSCWKGSTTTLTGNIMSDNGARMAGHSFYCAGGRTTILNCTIADSRPVMYADGPASFANCILWNPRCPECSLITGRTSYVSIGYSVACAEAEIPWPGKGNICADPRFVDPEDGDYHLLPTSPCIDMGTNDCVASDDVDIDGEPRIWPPLGIVDMGADEWVPPPTCGITYEPLSPTTDDVITFVSGAADPYDMVISVDWDFGDGGIAEGDPAAHQYPMPTIPPYDITNCRDCPDPYLVVVTVCNAAGLCATCTEEVMVNKGANIPPVCDVTYTPVSPLTDEGVTFNANAYDPNPWGMIVSYDWDFGDGNGGTGDPATHAYVEPGDYTVCVTVTDDQEGQATCCTRVTVTSPCDCDVAIDRTHCKMPAAGHIGQCKIGQIGARNMSYTEPCDVVLRVTDNVRNVVFETTETIGPGRRIRVRFEHCYTAEEIGRNLWSWEVWPIQCTELTPWNNVHYRRVIVHPGRPEAPPTSPTPTACALVDGDGVVIQWPPPEEQVLAIEIWRIAGGDRVLAAALGREDPLAGWFHQSRYVDVRDALPGSLCITLQNPEDDPVTVIYEGTLGGDEPCTAGNSETARRMVWDPIPLVDGVPVSDQLVFVAKERVDGGSFHWIVTPYDASAPSSPATPLSPVTLLAPIGTTGENPANTEFRFIAQGDPLVTLPVTGANQYVVQISRDPSFPPSQTAEYPPAPDYHRAVCDPGAEVRLTIDFSDMLTPAELASCVQLFWRVGAKNAADSCPPVSYPYDPSRAGWVFGPTTNVGAFTAGATCP